MRSCADCGADISDRGNVAYLCAPCARHRRRLQVERIHGTTVHVGDTTTCAMCERVMVKKAPHHIHCLKCRRIAARINSAIYRTKLRRAA